MKTTRTKVNRCRKCRAILDAASGSGEPKPGDFSVCIECGDVRIFGDDMSLRDLNAEEWQVIAEDPAIASKINAVKSFVRWRAAKLN